MDEGQSDLAEPAEAGNGDANQDDRTRLIGEIVEAYVSSLGREWAIFPTALVRIAPVRPQAGEIGPARPRGGAVAGISDGVPPGLHGYAADLRASAMIGERLSASIKPPVSVSTLSAKCGGQSFEFRSCDSRALLTPMAALSAVMFMAPGRAR